jgi:hypothetical protein
MTKLLKPLFLTAIFVFGYAETARAAITGLADETNAACPEGTEFLTSHRLCVSETEAVGPFTQAMIDKCIKFGGGAGPCYGDRWTRKFAQAIRGTSDCMPGAYYSSGMKECVSGNYAYGPFSKASVQKCLENGGDKEICGSMKVRTGLISTRKYNGTRPYLRLTRSGTTTYDGLDLLQLELVNAKNQRLGAVDAVSGQSWAQVFRKSAESETGSYEPLPEGLWQVENPTTGTNGIEWAGSPGDYDTYWNAGLGPTWTGIIPQKGYETSRQAIGIHVDGNRDGGPGTAGCVGITTFGQLKTFVSWFANSETAPRTILVDWNLGTLPDVFSLTASGVPFDLNPSGRMRYIPVWERIQSPDVEH